LHVRARQNERVAGQYRRDVVNRDKSVVRTEGGLAESARTEGAVLTRQLIEDGRLLPELLGLRARLPSKARPLQQWP
jgi:hypothetical protein